MTRLLTLVLIMAGAVLPRAAGAQGLFRSPVFVAQPGLIGSFAEGDNMDFNARVVTAIPLSIPRVTLVGIVQWTPFADEDGDGNYENSPGFVYGPVINLLNTNAFSFDVDALFAYAPNPRNTPLDPGSSYTHQFLVEGDLFLKIGGALDLTGQWSNLAAYAMLAYVISGQPEGTPSENRTVLLLGLSLPLAPWGGR